MGAMAYGYTRQWDQQHESLCYNIHCPEPGLAVTKLVICGDSVDYKNTLDILEQCSRAVTQQTDDEAVIPVFSSRYAGF